MEENNFSYKYPHPAVATDCVILGFDGTRLKVLLIERGGEPFKGMWAFPGGFMHLDETAEECARRELREETGLEAEYMEQFHTFSDVRRDPRERVLSIAYLALVRTKEVCGGDDAAKAQWFAISDIPQLAFDHERILRLALSRMRERIHFEPIGFDLLPERFTMKELQTLYEAVLGVHFDRRNFAKKMLHLDLLTLQENVTETLGKREAKSYCFNRLKYDELKEKGFRLEF